MTTRMDLPPQNYREITDRNEINTVLESAYLHRWEFSYSTIVKNHLSTNGTELTAVDGENGTFSVVDTAEGGTIKPNSSVIFQARSGGLSMLFTSKLVVPVRSTEAASFESSFCFPQTLRFSQQRRAVRINFGDLQEIPVTFFAKGKSPLQGKVVDISTSGAKLRFEGPLASQLGDAGFIADCQMRLPDDSLIKARAQVKGLIFDQELDISYVRCQFLEMQGDNALQLKKLINDALTMLKRRDPGTVTRILTAVG